MRPPPTRGRVLTRFLIWLVIGFVLEELKVVLPLHEVGHVLVARMYGRGGVVTAWDHAEWWGYVPNEDLYPWIWYVGLLVLIGIVFGFFGHVGGPLKSYFCAPWWGMAASAWYRAPYSWDWAHVWSNSQKHLGPPPTAKQVAAHYDQLMSDWTQFTVVVLAVIVLILCVWWREKPYRKSVAASNRHA